MARDLIITLGNKDFERFCRVFEKLEGRRYKRGDYKKYGETAIKEWIVRNEV